MVFTPIRKRRNRDTTREVAEIFQEGGAFHAMRLRPPPAATLRPSERGRRCRGMPGLRSESPDASSCCFCGHSARSGLPRTSWTPCSSIAFSGSREARRRRRLLCPLCRVSCGSFVQWARMARTATVTSGGACCRPPCAPALPDALCRPPARCGFEPARPPRVRAVGTRRQLAPFPLPAGPAAARTRR